MVLSVPKLPMKDTVLEGRSGGMWSCVVGWVRTDVSNASRSSKTPELLAQQHESY
jgi:hypothetical protein